MFSILRHAVAIGLPFALLSFLAVLWLTDFSIAFEHGLGKEEWLSFTIVSLSGLGLVYAFNSIVSAPHICKWSPFRSARGIHGLGNSFHRFLSLILITAMPATGNDDKFLDQAEVPTPVPA